MVKKVGDFATAFSQSANTVVTSTAPRPMAHPRNIAKVPAISMGPIVPRRTEARGKLSPSLMTGTRSRETLRA
jgi:hypothetical protein